jgi:acyl carrier protein
MREQRSAKLRLSAGRWQHVGGGKPKYCTPSTKAIRGAVAKSSVTLQASFSLTTTAMSEIAEKVKAIIIDKLGVEASEVTPEASFTNDLGADSLDTVELIMEFEKEFNVSIPDDQAENIQTVGQAVSYLEEHAK